MAVYDIGTDWNVLPGNTGAQNATNLQNMFDNYVPFSVVNVAPGTYDVDGTVTFTRPSDYRAHFAMHGAGRRTTRFRQVATPKVPTFDFGVTTGNFRDFVMRDICFTDSGITLSNVVYCLFDNVQFEFCEIDALNLGAGTSLLSFSNCWFVHCQDIINGSGGTATFDNCLVGEDCGGIYGNCNTRWNGGRIFQGKSKRTPPLIDGYPSFVDASNGSVHEFIGTRISLAPDSPLASTNLCRRVVCRDCDITMDLSARDAMPLFAQRNRTNSEASYSQIALIQCRVESNFVTRFYDDILKMGVSHWLYYDNDVINVVGLQTLPVTTNSYRAV